MVGENKERIVVENTNIENASSTERLPQVDAFVKYITENNPDENGILNSNYTSDALIQKCGMATTGLEAVEESV